jgi:hypothetical protein
LLKINTLLFVDDLASTFDKSVCPEFDEPEPSPEGIIVKRIKFKISFGGLGRILYFELLLEVEIFFINSFTLP